MPRANPWTARAGPKGLGRLQQLTHGARAFLRNLRYPPPRQARGADTTLRVRIIPCMSRPAQHLTWRLMRNRKTAVHSDRRIGAHLHQPGLAQPPLRKDWLAADADPPRATCATPRRATPLRTSCKRHGLPARGGHGGLAAGIAQLHGRSCARPRPSAACSNNVSNDSNSTDSIKAARVARQAEGTRPSWPALLAFLRRPGSSQPGLPIRAEQGGKLVSPIRSATAGRNRSAPCWTP